MSQTLPSAEDLTARAIETLATLVAFDTTSRGSNLALIDHVEATLKALGAAMAVRKDELMAQMKAARPN